MCCKEIIISEWCLICPSWPSVEEIHALLKALVLFHFNCQAEKLQTAFAEALLMMEAALPEVWPENLQSSQTLVRKENTGIKLHTF